jgi:hypothetical protein
MGVTPIPTGPHPPTEGLNMGFWSRIMSFIGSMFAPTSAIRAVSTVTDIVQTTKEGLETLTVTSEQREKTIEQTMKAVTDYHNSIVGENTLRSRTRRMIALLFVIEYITLSVGGIIVWRIDPGYSQHIFSVVSSQNSILTMILVFYFGYYAVKNVIKEVRVKKE